MQKVVVSGGGKGADIDVLACVVAYAELLKLEGKHSIPVVPGQFTMSVTPSILNLNAKYETAYVGDGEESFVQVDISDSAHFPSFVDLSRVTEVYDHRYGHEEYWKEKLSDNSHIEMVGACGTLIWEQFKKSGKADEISVISVKLLLASIVQNTLDFNSPFTTERDRNAYSELQEIAKLPVNWISEYYIEQEALLLKDFEAYLCADTKVSKIGTEDFAIGQIELWDASGIIETKRTEFDNVMGNYEPLPWLVNIINISKGFNHIYTTNNRAKEIVEQKLGIHFENNVAKTKELIMRKHLMKIFMGA